MLIFHEASAVLPLLFALTWVFPNPCASQDLPWPYNLAPHVKYYPEDEILVKRSDGILQRLQQELPVVVKKMSSNPDEMFFLDYWSFQTHLDFDTSENTNTSMFSEPEPPVQLHATISSLLPRSLGRFLRSHIPAAELFSKRDFSCPSGTNACTSINRPNVCCPTSSTCQIVPNTGLGDVGCCDAAQTCAGSLSQCPAGYISCPNNPGGGCCLPGFACFQEGCVQTSTVVVAPTSSSPPPPPTTVIDTTTVIVAPPPPSTMDQPSSTTIITTETITSSQSSVSPLPSSQPNTLVCSPGFRSCPASLGGGCCPADRACARDACPALTSTASLNPPVRGTSSSPTTTDSAIVSGCPNGFYACSAYHVGGCCQVDRDCRSTSCPARSGVTVVDSGSLTVVAPTGTQVSQGPLTGECARGWATCDANFGGGCCPSGFACGTVACTATVSGLTATQGKIAPNGAEARFGKKYFVHALVVGSLVWASCYAT